MLASVSGGNRVNVALNESPSQKEGKSPGGGYQGAPVGDPQ